MRYLCSLPITVIVISHSVSEEIRDLFDSIIFLTDISASSIASKTRST